MEILDHGLHAEDGHHASPARYWTLTLTVKRLFGN